MCKTCGLLCKNNISTNILFKTVQNKKTEEIFVSLQPFFIYLFIIRSNPHNFRSLRELLQHSRP